MRIRRFLPLVLFAVLVTSASTLSQNTFSDGTPPPTCPPWDRYCKP